MNYIETKNLIIRDQLLSDSKDIFNLLSNADVVKYLWDTLATDIKLIEKSISQPKQENDFRFSIILKSENKVIGTCGLCPEDDENWEFGFCFLPEYWGNGYGSETLTAIIDFAKIAGAIAIRAGHATENGASGKVMEKCGFTFYGFGEFTKCDNSKTFEEKCYRIILA